MKGNTVPTEEERRELIAALTRVLGAEAAATLMESLPPNAWDELATRRDLDRFATKADLDRFATKADLDRFASKADLAELRGELKSDFADLKVEMADLRAEVRSLTPKLVVAGLGSSATLFALVLGAAAVIR